MGKKNDIAQSGRSRRALCAVKLRNYASPTSSQKPSFGSCAPTVRERSGTTSGRPGDPIPMQDGWKEYLLCGTCEQRIGRWEKVVCEDLRGHGRASATRKAIPYDGPIALPPTAACPAHHVLETESCNYTAWRLFLLSLLWRMDRSTLTELATVDLGESRAEIQRMILAGDPGEPMDFPCWIYILSLLGEPMRGFMSAPHRIEYKGYPAVELSFAGLGWVFVIGREVACDTMRATSAGPHREYAAVVQGGNDGGVAHGRHQANGRLGELDRGKTLGTERGRPAC